MIYLYIYIIRWAAVDTSPRKWFSYSSPICLKKTPPQKRGGSEQRFAPQETVGRITTWVAGWATQQILLCIPLVIHPENIWNLFGKYRDDDWNYDISMDLSQRCTAFSCTFKHWDDDQALDFKVRGSVIWDWTTDDLNTISKLYMSGVNHHPKKNK